MKCPHCQTACYPQEQNTYIGRVGEIDGKTCFWSVATYACPECRRPVLTLIESRLEPDTIPNTGPAVFRHPEKHTRRSLLVPRGSVHPPAPLEVPADIASDFNEACLVLADSPKASAALSRRCLENLLQERGVSSKSNLDGAIKDALEKPLPSHIVHDLDAVRNIGMFAAHPKKSTSSGEILDVEPGEAEWNLDVLEALFDYYYVQPARSSKKRAVLNAKLAEVGKPPLKEPKKS